MSPSDSQRTSCAGARRPPWHWTPAAGSQTRSARPSAARRAPHNTLSHRWTCCGTAHAHVYACIAIAQAAQQRVAARTCCSRVRRSSAPRAPARSLCSWSYACCRSVSPASTCRRTLARSQGLPAGLQAPPCRHVAPPLCSHCAVTMLRHVTSFLVDARGMRPRPSLRT